jgi:hypothetical protein
MQGHRGDKRQRGGRRIARTKADERARMEIPRRRLPRPSLPPPPAGLADGAQPGAFGRALAGERSDIVVGGTGLRDNMDQNKDPAAI